jgi:hypothetical protein
MEDNTYFNNKFLAICDNFGMWHVVEVLENDELNRIVQLTNRELAFSVRDNLIYQLEQNKLNNEI